MTRNNSTNPWGDVANQAVGSLYKYYMSQPTTQDQLKLQYMRSQMDQNKLESSMDQRLYDMGGWKGAPASVQENLYTRNLGQGSEAARRFEDIYVTKPTMVDMGDVKQMVGVNGPMQEFGVGVAPETFFDKEGGRLVTSPAIPSQNRPQVQPPTGSGSVMADMLMPYLVNQESGGNPMALSPKGAGGLTQIMPDTARDPGYGVAPLSGWDGVDPRTASPEEQMRFGQEYLTAMINENGGDPALGLAAYNAGPGAVQQHGGIPPYAETQNYVQNVIGNAGVQPNGTMITELPKTAADIEREGMKNFSQDATMNDLNQTFASAMFNIAEGGAGLGSYAKDIPLFGAQTKAANLEADLSKITNKAALDKIAQYKEESKTGGFFGNLSEGERQAVADSQLAIRQAMNPQELAYRLMMHQDLVNDIIHGRGKTIPGTNQVIPMDAGAPRSGLPTIDDVNNATSLEDLTAMWDAFDRYPAFGGKPPEFIEQSLAQRVNALRGGQ